MFRSTPPLQDHPVPRTRAAERRPPAVAPADRTVGLTDGAPADCEGYLEAVEDRITGLMAEQRCRWQRRYPQLAAGLDAVEAFVAGGGKRLRPRFAYWGWVAAGGQRRAPHGAAWTDQLVDLGAAIELFHAFALIHDDVMDGSDTRRHQPTVHRRFAALHAAAGWRGEERRTAEGFAVLLGDLAFAYSSHLLVGLPPAVGALFDEMRIELHMGQFLDLCCAATGDDDPAVAADVVRFKTSTYSVQRPLQLGTALAAGGPGGADALQECWNAFGLAVGEAFQHRDDLLGIFGDPRQTGKPVGDDLQAGKNTLLLQRTMDAAAGDPDAPAALAGVGGGRLGDDDIAAIADFMRRCGAADEVEQRIRRLVCDALAVLGAAPLADSARLGLTELARAAAWRAR